MLFLCTALFSWLAACYLPAQWFPWWSFLGVCLLCGLLLGRSRRHAFWSGFLAILVLWGLAALVIDVGNTGILSTRMATLFSLPSRWLVTLITALVGGLLGGMATWSGYALRRI
ncbi:MAG: hypothetical protein KF690_09145 [Bacteroidetes bacterium]|nr:hypothetical protein [Bacteroidota bacterium]